MVSGAHPTVYRKIGMHLLPILFVSYFINFLDRVNVGFAKISMMSSLHMDEAFFGFGAGLFFIGYFIFEIPSNLALYRFGARKWIARIVFSWGILSVLTAFVHGAWQFYLLRFLLGAAEAGFFPGIILYLSWWYPAAMRARIVSLFLSAIAISGILGGPLSGWIMKSFNGHYGLEDWRWLFLLEGVPCFIVSLWILWGLPDRPRSTKWLGEEEKNAVEAILKDEEEVRSRQNAPRHTLQIFRIPAVWKLCGLYFFQTMGLYGVSIWLPSIIEACGVRDPLRIGFLSALPWIGGLILMFAFGWSSDCKGERKWHAVCAAVMGGVGIAISAGTSDIWISLTALSFGAGGVMALIAITWSLPVGLLSGAAAAAGIAMINSFGNLGGFFSPTLIGFIATRTKHLSYGLYMTAGCLFIVATLFLIFDFSPLKVTQKPMR